MKKTLFILLLTLIAGTSFAQQSACAYSYVAPTTTATFTHGWPIIGTQSVDSVRFDYGDGSPSVLFTAPVPFNSNHTYPGGGWYNTCLTRYISDLTQPNVVIVCNYCDSVFIPGPAGPCTTTLSASTSGSTITAVGTSTGGVGGYSHTYTVNPGSLVNSTGIFTGLANGLYTVCVTGYDSMQNPCTTVCDSVFVNNNTTPCTTTLSTFVSGSTITAVGTSTGGNAPYFHSYTLNPGSITNSTGIFNAVPMGWYSVCVTGYDNMQNICSTDCDSVFVSGTSGPCNTTISASSTGSSINAVGTATGGTAPYTYYYVLNPGNLNNTTGVFNGLTNGWYQVCVSAVDAQLDSCTLACDSIYVGNTQGPCTTTLSTSVTGTTINAVGTSTGGIGGYFHNYTVNPGSLSNSSGVFPGMAMGWYEVCVTGYDSLQNPCTTDCDSVYVADPNSVNDIQVNQLSIYPNPTNGNFTIEVPAGEKAKRIIIEDITGRKIISRQYANSLDSKLIFDLKNNAGGIYFIKLQTNRQLYTSTIVNQE